MLDCVLRCRQLDAVITNALRRRVLAQRGGKTSFTVGDGHGNTRDKAIYKQTERIDAETDVQRNEQFLGAQLQSPVMSSSSYSPCSAVRRRVSRQSRANLSAPR